jgi:hypothetical protein
MKNVNDPIGNRTRDLPASDTMATISATAFPDTLEEES